MSDKIIQLKFINKRVKYTVFGYIREAQCLFKSYTKSTKIIPQIIASICTIFYYENEYLTPCYQSIVSLDECQKVIESLPINPKFLYRDNTAYGSIYINPRHHLHSIFQWKIKLLVVNDRMRIGILTMFRESFFSLETTGRLYKYGNLTKNAISVGKWGNYYSPQLKTNDVITMELNIKHKNIRYYLNEINLGVAFKNIDIETSYYFGVNLRRNDKLELIHFQEMMVSEDLSSISYNKEVIENLVQLNVNIYELIIILLSQHTNLTIDDVMKKSIKQFVANCNINCKFILRIGRKAFLHQLKQNTNLKLGHGCKIFKYIERKILNQTDRA